MSTFIVDDADWNISYLSLSPGWNMISSNATSDNYLDVGEVGHMRPLLPQFHSSTVSWTTARYSSNEIIFNGTGIEVFGLAGPSQGTFSAVLDGRLLGAFDAHNDVDLPHVLLTSKGLALGRHNLTMINLEQGKAFTFDYAMVQTGLGQATIDSSTSFSSIAPTTFSAPSFVPHKSSQSNTALANLAASRSAAAASTAAATPLSTGPVPYSFTWSPIIIFVIAFGGVLLLSSLFGMLYFFLVIRRHRPGISPAKGPLKRTRRRTLLEALRVRRIGAPKAMLAPPTRDFRMDSDGSVRKVGAMSCDKDTWDEEMAGR